ncbi:hypothetical protein ILUMI_23555 [Ignelater luminosus]|uniref:Uncharacterized protein n=1 Tax=Ignelater luminosus TaxID=2038154 RepID=A0A8K0CC87_IGNLU|nr:hypothetical protein ILUMI_23555 [Ignelater luminosus]
MKSFEQETLRKRVHEMLGRIDTKQVPWSSRKKTERTPKLGPQEVKKLQLFVKEKISASTQRLSRKLNVSHTTIVRNLEKMNLKYRKRVEVPKYPAKQLADVTQKCRLLCRNVATPEDINYIRKIKFLPKGLVWTAIPEKSTTCSMNYLTSTSEVEVHSSVERRIIVKVLKKEGLEPSKICERLKRQYGKKMLSNISVYKLDKAFKDSRECVENKPHSRSLKTWTTEELTHSFKTIFKLLFRILLLHEISVSIVQITLSEINFSIEKYAHIEFQEC